MQIKCKKVQHNSTTEGRVCPERRTSHVHWAEGSTLFSKNTLDSDAQFLCDDHGSLLPDD